MLSTQALKNALVYSHFSGHVEGCLVVAVPRTPLRLAVVLQVLWPRAEQGLAHEQRSPL